jgi:hypothetical protein
MSHTPGPWKVARSSGDGKRIFVQSDLDRDNWHCCRCEVDSDDCDSKTAKANAILIAAAPELLDACKGLMDLLTDEASEVKPGPVYEAAANAIRKAEGK